MFKICKTCGRKIEIPVTTDQFKELNNWRQSPRRITEIAPQLNAGQRELFISGICPDCWDVLIGSDAEAGDEDA